MKREHRSLAPPLTSGLVWQDESFDRIVRNEGELEQKFNYILGNPWKRWPSLDRYPWVWPSD
jgi:REP-associated tyrosine transposase